MSPRHLTRGALALILVAMAASGCSCDSFRFYEVNRTFVDECDILPQGEFCDEEGEGLPAPVFEIWAIEHRGEETRIIIDEEVWFADPIDPELPNRITSSKIEVATVEPGPCTTTTQRAFVIDEVPVVNAQGVEVPGISGEVTASTRLTGPDDCGETPRGQRSVASILGPSAGAP